MSKVCVLCLREIEPGLPVIELAGGFFDREDPEFFVQDPDVLGPRYAHRQEIMDLLSKRP